LLLFFLLFLLLLLFFLFALDVFNAFQSYFQIPASLLIVRIHFQHPMKVVGSLLVLRYFLFRLLQCFRQMEAHNPQKKIAAGTHDGGIRRRGRHELVFGRSIIVLRQKRQSQVVAQLRIGCPALQCLL
jgi:hypothetical protein